MVSPLNRSPAIAAAPSAFDVDALAALLDAPTRDAPLASDVVRGIPVYAGDAVRAAAAAPDALLAEWRDVFERGAGIVCIRGAWTDAALAGADAVFAVELERAGTGTGDHFAKGGANVRVWDVHERLALASLARLGPAHQVTAQLNLVRPGGAAQACHRDYHLGFRTADELARYPPHVHVMSVALTLEPRVGGRAPRTPQDLARTAVAERWSPAAFDAALGATAAPMRSDLVR